ncbi:ABC transporter permease subunit [Kribbella sp. NPDC050820]|uniref:ABC transporter permease n=1 Tax=Kribbella sp. NPDC050820 TaxID=3155408 RepID=UPI0033CDDF2F
MAATYLMLGLAVPLAVTLRSSVDIHPFWRAYSSQLTSSSILIILERTLLLAVYATVITLVIGYPVAYAMTLLGRLGRTVCLTLLVFPYLTSFLVRTYAWIGILGVNGPIGPLMHRLGSDTVTYNYTAVGVLIVLVHVFLPVMILACYVSMSRIDPSHLRAARTLGANHLESFWRVYAPQTMAGVVAGSVVIFISSVGMYATPALIGGPTQTTLVSLVVQQVTQSSFYGLSPAYPAALTVILGVVVAIVLTLAARSVGLGEVLGLKSVPGRSERRPSRRSGRPERQPRRPLSFVLRRIPGSGRHHLLVGVMVLLAVVLIDGPFVYLVGMSFQPLPVLAFPSGKWSTKWYDEVLTDPSWGAAVHQSVKVALLATIVALVIGSFLALRTSKLRPFAGATVVATALLPLIVPSVMYATGIFTVFTEFNLLGNWKAIALVHSVLALPYVYVNVINGLNAYDPRWDQAAYSLGASPWRRLRKVTMPLLRPALFTGAFLAMLLSIDEFTVTLFTAGVTFQNLPLRYWSEAQQNFDPGLAVVGVLLTGFVVAVAALAALGLYVMRRGTKTHRSE